MFGISAKVEWQWKGYKGDEALAAAIDNNVKAIKNWKPFFRDYIHVVLEPGIVEQFVSEGKSGNTPWAPLAPSTIARRSRGGIRGGLAFGSFAGNLDILRRTNRLYESFLGGPDHIQTVTNQTLTWGTSVPYAPVHQTGGRRPLQGSLFSRSSKTGRYRARPRAASGGVIPARPILVMSEKMKSQTNAAIARFVARGAKDSGFMVRGATIRGQQMSFDENTPEFLL